jgi:hypothetical protein
MPCVLFIIDIYHDFHLSMPTVMNLHPKSTIILEFFSFVDKNGLLRRVWRRTDNTMAKRKSTKGLTNKRSTKITHRTKDRVIGTSIQSGGDLRCSGRFLLHCWYPSCLSSYKPDEVINEWQTHIWDLDPRCTVKTGKVGWKLKYLESANVFTIFPLYFF